MRALALRIRGGSTVGWLVVATAVWSVGVLVGAETIPLATAALSPTTSQAGPGSVGGAAATQQVQAGQHYVSVVAANGSGMEILAAIPLVVTLLVGALLLQRGLPERLASAVCWGLSGTLCLAALVATVTFLIGVFVLPVGALLLVCCYQARQGRRPGRLPVLRSGYGVGL